MPTPSFDNWTSLFLLAAVQGLFSCIVFTWKLRKTQSPFRWLIGMGALFSITLIAYVLYWTGYQRNFPYLLLLADYFPWLFGPFYYFYFRGVFTQQRFQRSDWLHLLPFLLFFFFRSPLYFIPMFAIGAKEPSYFVQLIWKLIRLTPWIKIIHMTAYALLVHQSFFALSRTAPFIKHWYTWLNVFFAGFIASYTAYFVLVQMPFFNTQWDYMVSLSMTIFIYGLATTGYLQPDIFATALAPATPPSDKYRNSGLTAAAAQQLQERLIQLMENQKLYQDSELRLEKLADMLGTSRHHLSQLINEQLGQSFFDYINTLRIEEARQLLVSTPKKEWTIIEIAYQVGFNNKVSFNAAFKKQTGLTPSQYRKINYAKTEKNNAPSLHRSY